MITLIIQTEDAQAAARLIEQATVEGCLHVAIEDGRVTHPAAPAEPTGDEQT